MKEDITVGFVTTGRWIVHIESDLWNECLNLQLGLE